MDRVMLVTRSALAATLVVAGTFLHTTAAAAQESNKDLVNALQAKHVALATGIEAAASKGKPISAKYEYEDGKLQLSVYTEKGGAFSEVIINHQTGKVSKTEKITEGDDLKDARSQGAAVAKAKSSLASALEKALAANAGYSAVGAEATLKDGKPVAEITLIKGTELKKVTQPLD
jgi:hypothetical protein